MNRFFRLFSASAIALATLPAAALAHDFFLLPSSGTAGTTVVATVGSTFPNPEIAVTPDRVATARGAAASGPIDVRVGTVSGKTLPVIIASSAQPAIVSLALKPRDVEYRDDRIDLIMDEYPVGANARAAVARLPRPRLLKVDSRRYAKTAICPQSCLGLAKIAAQGLELEFVAVADGRFRLLENGSPVASHEAIAATSDGKRQRVTTDARGEIALPMSTAGPVMLFASTMASPSSPEGRFVLRLTSFTVNAR